MTTLKELRQRGRVEQILSGAEETAEYRAQALGVLLGLGLEPEAAGAICDAALERETLSGYEPDSVQRQDLALAAMETIISLYTRAYEDRPITVSRAQFDVDPEIQIRVYGLDDDRVEQYRRAMQAGDEFPPVVAFWDGEILRLADGFHRLAAMPSTRLTVLAEVRTGGYAAASEYAATCNASHGLGMSRADKRAAVKRLLHIHEDLSSREIARRVGVSHPFVEGLRKQTGADPEERTVIRGDQEYTYTAPEREAADESEEPEYAAVWQLEPEQLRQRIGSDGREEKDVWDDYAAEDEATTPRKPVETDESQSITHRDRLVGALITADPHLLRAYLRNTTINPNNGLRIKGKRVEDYPYDLSGAVNFIVQQHPFRDRQKMIYCLYKAIVDRPETATAEPSQTVACPNCGGNIREISDNGKIQMVCEECGTVLEPDARRV